MHRRTYLIVIAVALALAVPATAAAPPEIVKLRRQVVTLKKTVKKLTVQRNTARREVRTLRARLTPAPSGSVALTAGEYGDRARATGLRLTTTGRILGQVEYLGGVTCEYLGPYPKIEATFFNAAGQVIGSGISTASDAVAGVRYPVDMFGERGAVRADAVLSLTCI